MKGLAEPLYKICDVKEEETVNETCIAEADLNPLGTHLFVLRDRRGWTQADVARRVPCSRGHISRIETGKIGTSVELVERVAQVFGLSAAQTQELTRLVSRRSRRPTAQPTTPQPSKAGATAPRAVIIYLPVDALATPENALEVAARLLRESAAGVQAIAIDGGLLSAQDSAA